MRKIHELIGQTFGRLTVLDKLPAADGGRAQWLCRCECGTIKPIKSNALTDGRTRSCGCLRKERSRVAMTAVRASKPPAYPPARRVWARMWRRCTNPKQDGYEFYGGRGIAVCEHWATFDNFYADMGDPPEGKSIDRVDNDGPYSPENCRWATPEEQANNRRLPGRRTMHEG